MPLALRARFALSRFCYWWLLRVRGYHLNERARTRADMLVLSLGDWARGYRIAPLWPLLKSAWRARLS